MFLQILQKSGLQQCPVFVFLETDKTKEQDNEF